MPDGFSVATRRLMTFSANFTVEARSRLDRAKVARSPAAIGPADIRFAPLSVAVLARGLGHFMRCASKPECRRAISIVDPHACQSRGSSCPANCRC